MDYASDFGRTLVDFWTKFQQVDPAFGFFQSVRPSEWDHCIPIALHGDEGRGKQKQPVMVIGIQAVLPTFHGKTNMEGHLGSQPGGI